MNELATICSLCNDSKIVFTGEGKGYDHVGEPTEAALKVLVEKLYTDNSDFNSRLASMTKAERLASCSYFSSFFFVDHQQNFLPFSWLKGPKPAIAIMKNSGIRKSPSSFLVIENQ